MKIMAGVAGAELQNRAIGIIERRSLESLCPKGGLRSLGMTSCLVTDVILLSGCL